MATDADAPTLLSIRENGRVGAHADAFGRPARDGPRPDHHLHSQASSRVGDVSEWLTPSIITRAWKLPDGSCRTLIAPAGVTGTLATLAALDEWPQLADLSAMLAEELDAETMRALNARVDVDGEDPAAVAEDWLREQGFIA